MNLTVLCRWQIVQFKRCDMYLIILSCGPKLDIWVPEFSGTEPKMPSGSGSNYVMML